MRRSDRAADRRRARSGAREGIVHRDLKPANIKVARRRREGAGLRPREGDGARRRCAAAGCVDVADDHLPRHDAGRNDPRHCGLHVAGAGQRQARGQAVRHLVLRVRSGPGSDRKRAFPGGERCRHSRGRRHGAAGLGCTWRKHSGPSVSGAARVLAEGSAAAGRRHRCYSTRARWGIRNRRTSARDAPVCGRSVCVDVDRGRPDGGSAAVAAGDVPARRPSHGITVAKVPAHTG